MREHIGEPAPERPARHPQPPWRAPGARPQLILALQRSAGNAAVARQLARAPGAGSLLGPAPPHPAGHVSHMGDDPLDELDALPPVPSKVEQEVEQRRLQAEKAFLGELRNKTRAGATLCAKNYSVAVVDLKAEHKEQEAKPGLLGQLIELAVGALAPALAGFVAGRLSEELKTLAAAAIEQIGGSAETEIRRYLTADRFVSWIEEKAKDQGSEAIKALGEAWGRSTVSPELPVAEMLNKFDEEFTAYAYGISEKMDGMSPAAQIAAHTAFDPTKSTSAFYKLQISDLLKENDELKAVAHSRMGTQRIVWLDAFGTSRLAVVSVGEQTGEYRFARWVPVEAWDSAEALGATQMSGIEQVAAPEFFNPFRHKATVAGVKPPWAGEQYAELVIHGTPRLAKVVLDEQGVPTSFVSWVDADQEAYARAKGAHQYGGIRRIDENTISWLAHLPAPAAK